MYLQRPKLNEFRLPVKDYFSYKFWKSNQSFKIGTGDFIIEASHPLVTFDANEGILFK